MSQLEHVGAGCRCSRLILLVAQFSCCGLLLTGALAQPVAPILPPRACALLRSSPPLSGVGRVALIHKVRRLRAPGWVQKALDVAAVPQDKDDLAPQQFRGRIAPLPRLNASGDASADIAILGYSGQTH